MSKLFALEEMELDSAVTDMEASPEEGEVADVQVEVEADIADAAQSAAAIEEGAEASDQLEQVEEMVADAVENGEGLDPIAAEATRIAVEAICARVGANPKAVYAVYATENFQSVSSRKANSKIALEAVGEFLKDLWKKIKAALTRLWEKVKVFWEKNLSTVGRVKKALESMKKRVGESSGKIKDKAYIEEAPSALAEALGFDGDISVKSVNDLIATHKGLLDTTDEVVDTTSAFNAAATTKIKDIRGAVEVLRGAFKDKKTGTLVGGVEISFKLDIDEEEGTVNLEVERENVERKDKGGVSLADKAAVKGMVDNMLKVIADNMKAREKQAKLQESFNKMSVAIEKAINDAEADADAKKNMRKAMKVVYKLNAKAPTINNECLAMNIRLAKAVLGYAALCVKNYK